MLKDLEVSDLDEYVVIPLRETLTRQAMRNMKSQPKMLNNGHI